MSFRRIKSGADLLRVNETRPNFCVERMSWEMIEAPLVYSTFEQLIDNYIRFFHQIIGKALGRCLAQMLVCQITYGFFLLYPDHISFHFCGWYILFFKTNYALKCLHQSSRFYIRAIIIYKFFLISISYYRNIDFTMHIAITDMQPTTSHTHSLFAAKSITNCPRIIVWSPLKRKTKQKQQLVFIQQKNVSIR